MNAGINLNSDETDIYLLRGGPAMRMPGGVNSWYGLGTDERKKLRFNYYGSIQSNRENSLNSNYNSLEMSYRPNNTISISFAPALQQQQKALQYVDEFSSNGENHYLLAHLDKEVVSFSIRFNMNLTPDLSIQYWGQPFFASGKYDKYKVITNPKAEQFSDRFQLLTPGQLVYNPTDEIYTIDENQDGTEDYSFDQPNFNFNEFLSNLVVRWEYLPGSTIYLVWSQSRDYSDSIGDFNFKREFQNLFNGNHPNNVFLLKLSYRIGLH